jgi:hypothetical protein
MKKMKIMEDKQAQGIAITSTFISLSRLRSSFSLTSHLFNVLYIYNIFLASSPSFSLARNRLLSVIRQLSSNNNCIIYVLCGLRSQRCGYRLQGAMSVVLRWEQGLELINLLLFLWCKAGILTEPHSRVIEV